MREFVKTLAYVRKNECEVFLTRLRREQTPCGLYFGVKPDDDTLNNYVKALRNSGINITYLLFIGTKNIAAVPPTVQGIKTVDLHDLSTCAGDMQCILSVANLHLLSLFPLFEKYGLDTFQVEDTKFTHSRTDMLYEHLPEIYDTYALLSDDASGRAFLGFLSYKFTSRLNDFVFAPEAQYFLAGFTPGQGDIVIDGGAYDGATARDFASLGAKVYSFEMDSNNFVKCANAAEKYGFVIENLGLGEAEKKVNYFHGGTASSYFGGGDAEAQLTSIDGYVRNKDLPRVDYIKLDVEGAEFDTLKGAARTISKWKPKMAISAYHLHNDIYTLPAFIKSIRPDYEFAFRHYPINAHDYLTSETEQQLLKEYGSDLMLKTMCEAVLYCR